MTDFIKSSQVIQRFLDKEKIKVPLKDCSLVVFRKAGRCPETLIVLAQHLRRLKPDEREPGEEYEYDPGTGAVAFGDVLCVYFGPGGADNSLKALFALRHFGVISEDVLELDIDLSTCARLVRWRDKREPWESAFVPKSHGLALRDLLYKIATEEK